MADTTHTLIHACTLLVRANSWNKKTEEIWGVI